MAFSEIQLLPGPSIIRPSIPITLGQEVTVPVTILDADGHPFDLTEFIPGGDSTDDLPGGPCPARSLPISKGVLFTVRTHRGQYPAALQCEAEIDDDPTTGIVTVSFTACDFEHPGLYLAELDLISDATIKYVYNLYVEVAPSLAWIQDGDPITIEEIRLWARDNSPDDNYLLDEVEYKDTEIIAAIRRVVDMWNELPPRLSRYVYNTTNFPFRHNWIEATIGFLMRIAAQNYLRNMLGYAAGGISIDDKKAKAAAYKQESELRLKEFKDWVSQTKAQLNADQAWGRVGFAPRLRR